MHTLSGGCHCGNIVVSLELSASPDAYNPRACDCTFCRKHNGAYVSDPQGSLVIRIKDDDEVTKYRQGSGIADCLVCKNCGVLIGAVYQYNGRHYAAVNVKALDGTPSFGSERPVSPKTLSEGEKVSRWKDIWFANVRIVTGSEPRAARATGS
jgi:hypothetical protein